MDLIASVITVPLLAVVLDAIIGDPHTFPHPVRYIGNGLDLFEGFVRKTGLNLRLSGWFALVFFSGSVWAMAELLIAIPLLGFIFAVYLGYSGLALGCLLKESRNVATLIDRGDIEAARKAVAMLVSRDTVELDEAGLRRTLAETLSENLNDGFVAPMLYLVLFGPGGMWAYKVVSTMDSMWGYKTERYTDLGYAGAKTDDVLAYVPARVTAWLMILVGGILGFDHSRTRKLFAHDARAMESPNAGWPMAAAAWLLGGQMGGATMYFGKVKDKPVLGPKGQLWSGDMIRRLLGLCRWTGYASTALFLMVSLLIRALH